MARQIQIHHDERVGDAARSLLEAWLIDEEVLVELIGRFPWARASETWVSAERHRLMAAGLDVPANHELQRLTALT
jgi:hypothetical protein